MEKCHKISMDIRIFLECMAFSAICITDAGGNRCVGKVISGVHVCVCLSMSTLHKENVSNYQYVKVYDRCSACIDPEVNRSKVRVGVVNL